MQVLADAFFQALQRRNEGLGHEPTAEGAETALGVGEFSGDGISEQLLTVELGGAVILLSCGSYPHPSYFVPLTRSA